MQHKMKIIFSLRPSFDTGPLSFNIHIILQISFTLFLRIGVLVMYNTNNDLKKEFVMAIQWQSEIPIYLQLYQQVIHRILEGHVKEGEALPSVRTLASEYQLNPLTISKAYQMLQDEQIVEKQRGKGLFVNPGVQHLILLRERQAFLENEWPLIQEKIKRLQLSLEELTTSLPKENSDE